MDTGIIVIVLESALLLGLVPAFVARAKGRSFLSWWLYGMTAFPVAMPHILMAPDGAANRAARPAANDVSRCPSCGEPIRRNALACRHCEFSFVSGIEWPSERSKQFGERSKQSGAHGDPMAGRRSGDGNTTSENTAANANAEAAPGAATDTHSASTAAKAAAAKTAAMAADLPWTDEHFARLRQSGPTAEARHGEAPPREKDFFRQDPAREEPLRQERLRQEPLREEPFRQDGRMLRPKWSHPRLAVIATVGALAVWLLVFGVTSHMPSPNDRTNSMAGLNPAGSVAGPMSRPLASLPAHAAAGEALAKDEAAPFPVPSTAEPSAATDSAEANGGASGSFATTSTTHIADRQNDRQSNFAFPSSLPPTILDDQPQANEAAPAAASEEAPQSIEGGTTTAANLARDGKAPPPTNASRKAAPARVSERHTPVTAPDRPGAATHRKTADGQRSVATRNIGQSPADDDSGVTAVGELVLWMQKSLAELGYYKGPLNGRAGAETSRAIRAYQRSAHLTPTGRINEALIVSLRRAVVRPVAFRESVH